MTTQPTQDRYHTCVDCKITYIGDTKFKNHDCRPPATKPLDKQIRAILVSLRNDETDKGYFRAEQAIKALITNARIDEREMAQSFLHGLTISPDNRHIFDVLSSKNHDRIKELENL